MLKSIVIALWLLIIYNIFMPLAGTLGQILTWLGTILLLAHLIEFFVFREKIKAKGDDTAKSFLMTMVFGFIYWLK